LISDKDAKTEYLNLLIDAIQFGAERKLDVKAAKIVAGLEPEKTNELLQALASSVKTVTQEQNEIIVTKVKNGQKFDGPGSAGSNKENRKVAGAEVVKEKKHKEKDATTSKEKDKSKERKTSKTEEPTSPKKKVKEDKVVEKEKPPAKSKTEKPASSKPEAEKKKTKEKEKAHDSPKKTPTKQKTVSNSGSSIEREPSNMSITQNGHHDPDLETNFQPKSPPRALSPPQRPTTSMGL
jgi:TRAF3-interacting protein 1